MFVHFKKAIQITLSLLLLASWQLRAQDIFYSKEERFDYASSNFETVGETQTYTYTYLATNEGYFLNAYNDSMTLKAKIALDFFPIKTMEAKFICYPENIIVLYQAEARNQMIQYAALLDEKAMLIGKPVAVDSSKTSWLGNTVGTFEYAVSQDKTKIAIYGSNKKTINITLLDNQLKKIFSKSQPINHTGKMSINQALVDNSGEFYFILNDDNSKSSSFELFSMTPQNLKITKTSLNQPNLYLSGLSSKINSNNKFIYTSGVYSDKKNGNILGVVYFNYDPENKSFSSTKIIPLNDELRSELNAKNKSRALNDLKTSELIVKNDGGFVLIAEEQSIITQTETTPGWGYYSWYYAPNYPPRMVIKEFTFGNILALNYDADNKLTWYKIIHKNQYSKDDDGLFSSFAFLNSGASLVIMFNDFQSPNNPINVTAIDGKGNVQSQLIDRGNIGNSGWVIKKAVQTSKTTWLIPVVNRNNLFFAKVQF